MDKLKQYIDENREAFDELPMPDGHQARFEKKLMQSRKHTLREFSFYGALLAACVALFFLLRFSLTIVPEDEATQSHLYAGCGMSQEIHDLQLYYTMQMNELVLQLQAYDKKNIPGTRELLDEMNQVLYDNSEFEDTILPVLPCSDAAIFAMSRHYGASLESLQIMLNQLQQMK